ncbi:MAG: glycosyltransferase, partial [Myxococcales bacterium]|nr:glycosyltransferase [Myxococcales bacterium]
MKVALNMGTLRGAGSSSVGKNTLKNLCAVAPQHEFTAWIPHDWRIERPPNCNLRRVKGGMFRKLASENIDLRLSLRKGDFDVLYSLGDTSLPHCPVPHLLLVQQAYLAYRPDDWGFVPPPAFRTKMHLVAKYFALGLSTVSAFTVQTHDMKHRLCDRWDLSPDHVHVVPSAISIGSVQSKNDRRERTICYVASPAPHKNFEVLADTMSYLSGEYSDLECHLTVHQGQVPGLVHRALKFGVLHRFKFLGALSHMESLELIARSAVCVVPSHLESFGLLYYEAAALGTPIVAADR